MMRNRLQDPKPRRYARSDLLMRLKHASCETLSNVKGPFALTIAVATIFSTTPQEIGAQPAPTAPEIRITPAGVGVGGDSAAIEALDGGGYIVVWDAGPEQDEQILGRTLDAAARPIGAAVVIADIPDGRLATRVVTAAEMRRALESAGLPLQELPRQYDSETALRYRFADDGAGELGLVAPVSEPFCGKCSRIRLTADGKIRTCLFSRVDHDLRGLLRAGAPDS